MINKQNVIQEFYYIAENLKKLDINDKFVTMDMTLARGLEYYTGIIYEAVAEESTTSSAVGSIAGGGRYDELIGKFTNFSLPAIGVSFGKNITNNLLGIERILALAEQKFSQEGNCDVLVCSIGETDSAR